MGAVKKDQGKPPVVQGFMNYFPRAIKAVSLASKAGLKKYELEYEDRNFMGLDPSRLHDADGRHILDEAIDGMYDPETKLMHPILHAWEAMARLEILLKEGCPEYKPVQAGAGPSNIGVPFYQDDDKLWLKGFKNSEWTGSITRAEFHLICDNCGESLGRHGATLCFPNYERE